MKNMNAMTKYGHKIVALEEGVIKSFFQILLNYEPELSIIQEIAKINSNLLKVEDKFASVYKYFQSFIQYQSSFDLRTKDLKMISKEQQARYWKKTASLYNAIKFMSKPGIVNIDLIIKEIKNKTREDLIHNDGSLNIIRFLINGPENDPNKIFQLNRISRCEELKNKDIMNEIQKIFFIRNKLFHNATGSITDKEIEKLETMLVPLIKYFDYLSIVWRFRTNLCSNIIKLLWIYNSKVMTDEEILNEEGTMWKSLDQFVKKD